jgi:hypothetical protein
MSDNIKQLSKRALEIFDITQENCDIGIIEQYYSLHNLWLRYSPIPSRPIFQTAWFEAGILTETMIFLSFHGFYEQACATLRIQLDGFMTRLYWDVLYKLGEIKQFSKDSRYSNDYWEWESGNEKAYPRKIYPILRREEKINAFDKQYKLCEDVEKHKQLLHKYVHGRPPSRHVPGSTRASMLNIQFDKKRFDEWFDLFKTNVEIMIIFSILLYPSYMDKKDWREFILLAPDRLRQVNSIGIANK